MPSRRIHRTRPTPRTAMVSLAIVVGLLVSGLGAATTAFAGSSSRRLAACDGVNLRIRATTSSPVKKAIVVGTTVTATAIVDGGPWKATCHGKARSGGRWYRISTIDGRSVASLYGTGEVYAATGLFTTVGPSTPISAPTTLRPAPGSRAPLSEPTTLQPASSSRTGAVTEGIDVSHWQGVIDWTKVHGARKRFAYIKASDGTSFVDDRYAANRAGAKAAGLDVGAYHFARPDATAGDAVAEADHFVDTAAWSRGELLPVLDLEQAGGLSVDALQTWVRTFLGRVAERTGVRAIIYVSPSFWTTRMGDTTWFADHGYQAIWIAHWTSAEAPRMPASDWSSRGWTYWQYSSDGSVPGISGRVDLDRYRGVDFSRVRIP